MPTQAKIDLVASLKKTLSGADNIFVTDYSGLDVAQITKLRKELRDSGIKYIVAKNTLMRIAAKDAGYDDLVEFFNGPIAVAVSNTDPNVPAKILYDTYKEYKELKKPEILAFYIDSQLFDGSAAAQLAKLPTRDVLLSQLVSAVEGPISEFVGTLDAIIRELVGTIDALAKKKEEEN
ncbi:MAG: 50S ribosomal protein L10 [candidate division Zixibacteria bacterium]|nr:50S ribosomal protein L10 [candidate division Zixibacteria bacterium]